MFQNIQDVKNPSAGGFRKMQKANQNVWNQFALPHIPQSLLNQANLEAESENTNSQTMIQD